MKTERRHELQTNVLAESLAHWIEAAKPYSRAVLAVLVALVVGIFAWGYLSAQNGRRNAEGWQYFFDAFTKPDPTENLNATSDQFAGTSVGEWSKLVLADIELSQGTDRLFADKKEGRDELRNASEKYRSILSDSTEPMLLARATFGLARAHEALGSLEDARKEYRSLAERWPDSPYAEAAERRAKDLDQPGTKSFYDWFAAYEPPRPMSREPGTPGARPDFMKDPDESRGLNLPQAIDDKTPLPKFGEGEAASETPAGEEAKPGEGDAAPAAEDKPADSKPAEAAAESPPAEQPAEPAAK